MDGLGWLFPQVSRAIKDEERGGNAKLEVFMQGEEPAEFWKLLGGKPASIAPPSKESGTEQTSKAARLFRVHEEGGKFTSSQVAGNELKRSMLDSGVRSFSFVLEDGTMG